MTAPQTRRRDHEQLGDRVFDDPACGKPNAIDYKSSQPGYSEFFRTGAKTPQNSKINPFFGDVLSKSMFQNLTHESATTSILYQSMMCPILIPWDGIGFDEPVGHQRETVPARAERALTKPITVMPWFFPTVIQHDLARIRTTFWSYLEKHSLLW